MYPNNYYYQPQQQPAILKGRPVASFEEARAIPIDFDGTTFFFPDLANKRIYTKQINLDGSLALNMYELKTMPIEEKNNDYVTREEFERVLRELRQVALVDPAPAPMTSEPVSSTPNRNVQNMF